MTPLVLAILLGAPARAEGAATLGAGALLATEDGPGAVASVGYEPVPFAAVEATAELAPAAGTWAGGLALVGRWWFLPALPAGEGLYAMARLWAGAHGDARGHVGPALATALGFGARPVRPLQLELATGPGPGGWRNEFTVSLVLEPGGLGGGAARHRPSRRPGE